MAIYPSIPRAEYDALPGINWSALKCGIGKTAAHIRAAKVGRKDTPAFKFGRAFHHAVLQPDHFAKWEVVGGKTTSNPGAITQDECDAIQTMAVNAYDLHNDEITHRECGLTWNLNGQACKALIDGIWHKWLLDLKSTMNAEPHAFKGEIFKLKYHGQCAWYLDGLAANNMRLEGAALLAAEKTPPHAVGLYGLNSDWIELGRKLYDEALIILKEDGAPSYGYQDLDVPEWAQPGLTVNDDGGIDL